MRYYGAIILFLALKADASSAPRSIYNRKLKIRPSRGNIEPIKNPIERELTNAEGSSIAPRLMIRPIRRDMTGALKIIGALRGGNVNSSNATEPDALSDDNPVPEVVVADEVPTKEETAAPRTEQKVRRTYDVIRNILENKESMKDESIDLRQLIESRAAEYLMELESSAVQDAPTPLKVLHYLAPKVPAIKHSPDFMLRIQTARGDIDAGVAASLIATIARLCVQYDRKTGESIGKQVIKDRRFEQLVECVLCGVDVKYRKRESEKLAEGDNTFDMEELLDEEDAKIDEGLRVQDACRAAWGIAMLCGYEVESFGGHLVTDILVALSLRTRSRLLARLQMLRQGELRTYTKSLDMSLAEGLAKDTESLAEDAGTAIWTFACVKANTGLRTVPLLEACCSLLCQNPTKLREREQAKKTGLNDANFELDDVVERVAQSASIQASDSSQEECDAESDEGDKDALLHWLAPKEVCGTMWAVALHGRTDDTGSKQEMDLSDTATALSDIAFDCIDDWLEEDLQAYREARFKSQLSHDQQAVNSAPPEKELVVSSNGRVVEVVDAAALLAMEESTTSLEAVLENADEKETASGNAGMIDDVGAIQVVDAATLLASQESKEQVEMATEVMVTSASAVPLPSGSQTHTPAFGDVDSYFSNPELCSIAWAATDLQDSLRNTLVDLISKIFLEQGKQSMKDLDGGELSNLAWALARRTSSADFSPSDFTATGLHTILEWIAERSLFLIKGKQGSAVFERFRSPELGRMMWSLSTTLSNLSQHTGNDRSLKTYFREFALLTLKITDSNSKLFGTEDLARICWGFLELSVLEEVFRDPMVSACLGRLISIMEASVLRWESGQCEKGDQSNTTQIDESFRFASFLGKPRFSLRLLEQRLDTRHEEDDEQTATSSEKSHLPLLRDLSMDPATMCKLAYGLSRSHELYPEIDGAWTFTRIAVRLLCSKNGQLLKVSSPGDDIRLAYACATNELAGYGREFVTRLYARRFVQYLNDKLGSTYQSCVSDRLALSPHDTSTLIWSLGELGARHWKKEEGANGTAYKKLRFVTDIPLLSEPQLSSLPSQSIARLLHGAVSMEMFSSTPDTVVPLLRALESKAETDFDKVDLCELAECLARIKLSTGETEVITALPTETAGLIEDSNLIIDDVYNSTQTTKEEEEVIERMAYDQAISKATMQSCLNLLAQVAIAATSRLDQMTAGEMRRLLLIYAGLPSKADEFIDAADKEISKRLEAAKYVTNLHESANRAATAARGSWDALADKSDSDISPLASLRKGLRNLFVVSHDQDEDKDSEEESTKLRQVADLLTETATTANMVTDHFARVSKLTNQDPGMVLSTEQRGAVFELSRCQELIESYRRVNFGTGKRLSRQDTGHRKDVAKQVISRIIN